MSYLHINNEKYIRVRKKKTIYDYYINIEDLI